jgi:hypothetical protein
VPGTHRRWYRWSCAPASREGQWTALAARQAAYLVAHLTPQEAEGVLAELGNMRPSKSSLDRLPKRLSERWEAEREAFEASLRAELVVPEGAVTLARCARRGVGADEGWQAAGQARAGPCRGQGDPGPGWVPGGRLCDAVLLSMTRTESA